jgi:hypothetical protein
LLFGITPLYRSFCSINPTDSYSILIITYLIKIQWWRENVINFWDEEIYIPLTLLPRRGSRDIANIPPKQTYILLKWLSYDEYYITVLTDIEERERCYLFILFRKPPETIAYTPWLLTYSRKLNFVLIKIWNVSMYHSNMAFIQKYCVMDF